MYDVARFVPSKREDWDNGCGPTERADLDALRYERTHSPMGEVMRAHLFGRQTDATPGKGPGPGTSRAKPDVTKRSDSVCGESAALIANDQAQILK